MLDPVIVFVIASLIIVIIIQALTHLWFVMETHKEMGRMTTAVLSKNVGEYTAAKRVDKELPSQQNAESDDIDIATASDEVFDKMIRAQTL